MRVEHNIVGVFVDKVVFCDRKYERMGRGGYGATTSTRLGTDLDLDNRTKSGLRREFT